MANNNQMTPTQRNYAIERVNDIVRTKDQAVRKTCLRQEACTLSLKDLAKLIISGVIKPMKQNELHTYGHYTRLDELFDIEACTTHYRSTAIYDEAAYEKKMAAIRQSALVIKDKLMLGDASEALKMVNDFEAEFAGKKSR